MNNLDLFIKQIIAGIETLKLMGTKHPSRSRVKEGVRREIQYYGYGTTYIYSQKAKDFCEENGIDITKLPKKSVIKVVGGERNRPAVMAEHTTPIGELIEMMVQSQIEDVAKLLEKYSVVCWITREEDDKLNSLSFRKKRPGGWEVCYKKCGITVNDFSLISNAPLETGGVLVSEEVKLNLDLQMMEVVEEMETSSPA